ncbi:MAG: archaeosortase/exosortase family protein, partial [Desulfobulbaceae bacterium]|nr:archaeosortase/exosortase family protein [Desulfobulbaceae bacterium]
MIKKTATSKNGGINRPRFSILNFVLFTILVLIGNAPLWFFPDTIIPFQKFMVKIVGGLINASGLEVVQNGVYIAMKNGQWVMTPECTALSAMIVFIAFVVVYPSSIKSKGIAVLAGIPFLIIANTLRLFTLAWATELFAKYAHIAHDYVWQVAFLILIAVMWLVWIEMVVKHESKTTL